MIIFIVKLAERPLQNTYGKAKLDNGIRSYVQLKVSQKIVE